MKEMNKSVKLNFLSFSKFLTRISRYYQNVLLVVTFFVKTTSYLLVFNFNITNLQNLKNFEKTKNAKSCNLKWWCERRAILLSCVKNQVFPIFP